MGLGDELMAMGQAQRVHDADPHGRKVAICERDGRVRWDVLWAGNTAIATPKEAQGSVLRVVNAIGARPYIQYPFTAQSGITFTNWRARDHVGTLCLTETELDVGRSLRKRLGSFVVIQPDVKAKATPNKDWGLERFAAVVAAFPSVTFVRVHGTTAPVLPGVRNVLTKTFREACGVIAASDAVLATEGGIHHAAGVLRKPGVVIFGGFISPETTGYPWHVNLADHGKGSPCGRWSPCSHCRAAMDRITVEQVTHAMRRLLADPLERAS